MRTNIKNLVIKEIKKNKDITGKRYHRLLVLNYIGSSLNDSFWKCRCDCGGEYYISRRVLLNSKKPECKSCNMPRGQSHPCWKGCGEISMTFYSRIRREARNRKLKLDVSIEYMWELFIKQERKCALTGVPLFFADCDNNIHTATASLDRINSDKGYIKGNIQWVHKAINHIKSNIPDEYFILICNLVSRTKHSRLTEKDFLENGSKFIKTISNVKRGEENHRSKIYTIEIEETKKKVIVKSLENYCKENNLSIDSMRRTRRVGYYHRGFRVIKAETKYEKK